MLRVSVPFLMYGPNLPFDARISTPSAGSVPTTRGNDSSANASSSVTVSTAIVLNSDDVRGRSFDPSSGWPSCT
ncbi:unannotated protein [freshwater metagenome]|uniref:Unannotated protein n=1 Tax=freshwater metagenome TaxID=449393 RepID=A0A6J7HSN9_9ZZZZ